MCNPINKRGGIVIARRYSSEESKKRILSACVKLFIENGYHSTTLSEILSEADVTSSTFQNIFKTKDGVLLDLTEFMFESQFAAAKKITEMNLSPVYTYAIETSIQMTLAELNENLRDVYVEAYTNAETSEFIFVQTSKELFNIFGNYVPNGTESSFYEMEIGTAGIMRNYMAKKCDMYFTLEKKLERFLSMTLGIYNVPEKEKAEVIAFVMKIDVRKIANQIMQELFRALAMRFEFELG